MNDENINPQNISIQPQENNLTDNKPTLLNLRRTIFITLLIVLTIGIPVSLFLFFNQTKKSTSPTPVPTSTPTSAAIPTPVLSQAPLPSPAFVPDEVIVKYKSGQSPDEINDDSKKRSLENFLMANGMLSQERLHETNDPVLKTFFILKLKKGVDLQKLILLLKEREEVESVELNYVPELF